MTLQSSHLYQVDQHWAVKAIGETKREEALKQSDECLVNTSLQNIITSTNNHVDFDLIGRLATAYEIAATEGLEFLIHRSTSEDSQRLQYQSQAAAHRAFGLRRILPIPTQTPESYIFHALHLGGLGYCSDRWTDLRRWLEENSITAVSDKFSDTNDCGWDKHLLYNLFDAWVRLFRKKGWDDLNHIGDIIISLRNQQKQFEENYLRKDKN